jgi:5-methylcytosine-specific restriction endonuclease McrA
VVDRSLAVKVFIRDEWKCRYCGNRERLHPHHIKFKSQGRKDSLDNLITLCYNCHRKVHNHEIGIEGNPNVGVTYYTSSIDKNATMKRIKAEDAII